MTTKEDMTYLDLIGSLATQNNPLSKSVKGYWQAIDHIKQDLQELQEYKESNQSVVRMWEQGKLKIVDTDKQTNRQWLESLSDEELAKYINGTPCDSCIYETQDVCQHRLSDCDGGIFKWLQAKHKE